MKTQLNLYDEIRPRHVRYNLMQLGAALTLLLLALAAWGAYSSWSVRSLSSERAALESQEQALTPQIETLQAELASDDRLAVLRRRVDRLTLELQGRERMLALIADLSNRNVAGFSPALRGLGSASRGDAWLTAISLSGPRIDAAPERVRLRGRLLDAQALARYLDVLAQVPALSGVQFGTVIVGEIAALPSAGDDAEAPERSVETTLPFELDSRIAERAP